jgi:hypothetical protein
VSVETTQRRMAPPPRPVVDTAGQRPPHQRLVADRFARIPARAARYRDLSARDWRVLVAIASFADRAGRAYPSMTRIAKIVGINRGDVPRSIRRLEQLGLLHCQRRERPAGGPNVNLYTVVFEGEGASAVRLTGVSTDPDGLSALTPTGRQQERMGDISIDADLPDKEQTNGYRNAGRASSKRVDNATIDRGANDLFETFWRVYPSRGGHSNPKKPAREKFEAATRRGVNPTIIIRGAENYLTLIERGETNPRFVAQAFTWLSQERWNDYQEVSEPPRLAVGMI